MNYLDIIPTELVELIYKKLFNECINELQMDADHCKEQGVWNTYEYSTLVFTENYDRTDPLWITRGNVWDYKTIKGLNDLFRSKQWDNKRDYWFYNQKTNEWIKINKKVLLEQVFKDNGKKFVKTKSVKKLISEWNNF